MICTQQQINELQAKRVDLHYIYLQIYLNPLESEKFRNGTKKASEDNIELSYCQQFTWGS